VWRVERDRERPLSRSALARPLVVGVLEARSSRPAFTALFPRATLLSPAAAATSNPTSVLYQLVSTD
jgi:hypothetical protein